MFTKKELTEGIGSPLANTKSLPVCVVDSMLNFKFANAPLCELFEYTEEEMLQGNLKMIVGSIKIKKVFFELMNLIRDRDIQRREWIGKSKTGKDIYVVIEGSKVRIKGKRYFAAVVVDYTKQAELETALERKHKLNDLVERISQKGNFEFNPATNEITWSDGLYNIFELPIKTSPPTLTEQMPFFTTAEQKRLANIFYQKSPKESSFTFDTQIFFQNGRTKDLEVIGRVEKGSNIFHGSVQDITEKKRNNQQLLEEERKFRQLTETMPHIICVVDPSYKPLYLNEVGEAFYGKSKNDFGTWNWLDILREEDYMHLATTCMNPDEATIPVVSNVLQKGNDGKERWFNFVIFPQYDSHGVLETWTMIGSDIHEQFTAREELQKSNNRLRSLINASPLAIYSINRKGIVRDIWNPAAERILGWSREEALGNFLPQIHEIDPEDFPLILEKSLVNGQINTKQERTRKTGEKIMMDITGGAIYDDSGNIDEVIVTQLDITEMVKQREQLESSLEEKNVLLQEVHHRVKNNLAIIVSLLQLQVYQSSNEDEKNKLMDAQNRIKSIAMVHELLYSTDEFNKINLNQYYEHLLDSIKSNLSGVDSYMDVNNKIDIDLEYLNLTQAIPLGLLINELVTNTLKYAFPNKKDNASITLMMRKKNESTIHVCYSDNGIGFDPKANSFTGGLGFQIIYSLLAQLEANYTLTSDDGVTLEFDFEIV